VETATFLQTQRVFTLDQAVRALNPPGGRRAALARLKYYLQTNRLKAVTRGVYATVPPGTDPERFQPDRYLAAAAVRPDGVFSHHAALELLGAAHSEWTTCSLFTKKRRPPLSLDGVRIEFLAFPPGLLRARQAQLGTRKVERLNFTLKVTGPERTLVDGFRQPARVGGVEELVESAAGFSVLDLKLLRRLLEAYAEKTLWAAVGWFLERYQKTFFAPPDFLESLESRRPKSAQYLLRGQRGGTLLRRWNLILPEAVAKAGEPDER